ncbi:hypothetical protein [Spirochaeta isovalerica]|uniref:Uncharacterized protein n=1 Tax=Spirochaeta isovalerica TaxID=150 RepID=A0A841RAF6_9SPIO|nr:hypothetical protein [Spirochaeta isovalerica]MBB6480351.1 hypothetical protein [Spirochaeta isovalerica]
MIQNALYAIKSFFYQFSKSELILVITAAAAVLIALIALFTALGLFRKNRKTADIRRMLVILQSLDLLYYSLDKHVHAWKAAKSDGQSAEAQKFWRFTDLTELVTRLQELKVLSKVYMKKTVHLEIEALLEFLGELILISYRGEDHSGRRYRVTEILSTDNFDLKLNEIIMNVSRGVRFRNKKAVEKEAVQSLILKTYLK